MSYITAGTESFSAGKMYCQGEDKRVGGRFLKDVLINEKITVTVSKEEYIELEGKLEAVSDRQKIACLRRSLCRSRWNLRVESRSGSV